MTLCHTYVFTKNFNLCKQDNQNQGLYQELGGGLEQVRPGDRCIVVREHVSVTGVVLRDEEESLMLMFSLREV